MFPILLDQLSHGARYCYCNKTTQYVLLLYNGLGYFYLINEVTRFTYGLIKITDPLIAHSITLHTSF